VYGKVPSLIHYCYYLLSIRDGRNQKNWLRNRIRRLKLWIRLRIWLASNF